MSSLTFGVSMTTRARAERIVDLCEKCLQPGTVLSFDWTGDEEEDVAYKELVQEGYNPSDVDSESVRLEDRHLGMLLFGLQPASFMFWAPEEEQKDVGAMVLLQATRFALEQADGDVVTIPPAIITRYQLPLEGEEVHQSKSYQLKAEDGTVLIDYDYTLQYLQESMKPTPLGLVWAILQPDSKYAVVQFVESIELCLRAMHILTATPKDRADAVAMYLNDLVAGMDARFAQHIENIKQIERRDKKLKRLLRVIEAAEKDKDFDEKGILYCFLKHYSKK